MAGIITFMRTLIVAALVIQIKGKVTVSFRLVSFENTGHIELDGGCCDNIFGSCSNHCDNRFNLCFDIYGGNNNMADCFYENGQTERLYENNDDFNFPASLGGDLVNPIIFTVDTWSTGFRSKIEVWDYDPSNGDDKIDYYGYNYNFSPQRTSALATEHTVTLNGAGTSLTRVAVKVYCAVHYYGTSSGCSTYCLARDNSQGHYDCNDITGARMCHAGWTGSYCNVEINECASNPCQYNAACTDLLADYRCNCPAGTQNKNCDDIDECASDPCEHGGTCENKLNQYQCHCPREYSGVNCEFEIDLCDPNPCLNGATCLGENDNGVLECVCVPGYSGTFCNNNIDECIGVDCLNNGTCMDGVNQFTCTCIDGYSGTYCDLDIRDECASNPCQNNASCVDEVDGYVCICPAGFENDNCEEDINECDPNPCVYGNCSDKVSRYTCECWPGYSGENCTVDIDDCVDHLCQYNSTCQDGVNNYTCSCLSGYTGIFCDINIDECASSPCQNGGRCDDDLNNFTCKCGSTGYRGQLCEIDIDECQNEGACPSNKICVNVNGSYDCNERPEEPTPIPGLCRTSICYNDGTCQIINGSYQCVCTGDFSGELCETPTAPCTVDPYPCMNDGLCQVETAENGSVYYYCQCTQDYAGYNCELNLGSRTGGPSGGGFAYWYFVLIGILLVILIIGAGMCFYRVHRARRDKFVDDVPTVFANPHTESISIPVTLGATAGPPLPPKGKLEDPNLSMTFSNNLYSDIDGPVVRGACGLSSGQNSKDDFEKEDPYATGGYIHMNGHAGSPTHENPYELARDLDVTDARPVKENDYSSDPTITKKPQKTVDLDGSYSTTIFPDKDELRPVSTAIPPPLPQRDNSKREVPAEYDIPRTMPAAVSPSLSGIDPPYSFNIYQQDEDSTTPAEASLPSMPNNPFSSETPLDKSKRDVPSEYDIPRSMPTAGNLSQSGTEPPYSFNIYQQDEDSTSPTDASLPSNPNNPFSSETGDEQPPTPTSGTPTPSSPSNPYSTTLYHGENNQSNA